MKKYIMFSSVSAEKYFIICISCPILQNRFLYDSSGSILRMQKSSFLHCRKGPSPSQSMT